MINKVIKKEFSWSGNTRIILIGAILWLILCMSLGIAYKTEWVNSVVQPRVISSEGAWEEEEILALQEGDKITQQFEMQANELDGISLYLGTVEDARYGLLVELWNQDTKEMIQTWEWTAKENEPTKIYRFMLDKALSDVKGKQFSVCVYIQMLEEGEFSLSLVSKGAESGTELNVNGEFIENTMVGYELFNGSYIALKYFLFAFLIGVLFCFFIVVWLLWKQVEVEKMFVGVAIILGILYMFVLAPFSVPDEPSHFATAYAQSSILLGENTVDDDGNILMDSDLWHHSKNITKDSYVEEVNGMLGRVDRGETISTRTMLKGTYLGYIPQVLGISLARLAGAKGMQIIMAGRMAALVLYCVCMYLALKMMPVKKGMLAVIGLFPMTLQQVVSYNYDSVVIDASFVLTALLISKIVNRTKITARDVIILGVTVAVVGSLKFIYLPVLLLALCISPECFGGKKQKKLVATVTVIFSCVVIMATRLSSVIVALGGTVAAVDNTSRTIALSDCLESPLLILSIFWRTLERNCSGYLGQMIASPLGWLNVHIPNLILILFLIVFLFSLLQIENNKIELPTNVRITSSGISALVVILVMTSLMFDWTPVGSKEILGIQGRYFLPVLPVAGLTIQNRLVTVKRDVTSWLILLSVYLNCYTLYFVMLSAIGQ